MGVTGRARKILLTIGVVVGLILLVLASLSLVVRIPSIQAQIRSRIESELQAQLDRQVEIGAIRISPLLSLDLRNIRIATGKRLQDGTLAEVERLQLYPNLVELLRLRLGINRIVLRRPIVTLDLPHEAAPAGPPTPPALPTPVALPLGIAQVQIRDGSVGVKATGAQVNLDGLHLDVTAPEGAIQATLRIEQGKIQAGPTPLSVKDLVLRAGIDGDDIRVKQLGLTALGADVQVQGRVQSFLSDPALDLTLKARSELAGLFPKGPPVPLRGAFTLDGKATGPLADPSFTGQANISGGQIEQVAISKMTVALEANRRELRLKQLTLKTGSGDLTGDVAVTLDKLRYRLALQGKRVNLADVLRVAKGDAPVGGEATLEVMATGEGADLRKAKGQADVRVEEFHLSDHPKERGHVHFALEGRDGRVHVRQGKVELASTRLRTKGVVKLGGDLDLDVDMRFSKLVDFGRLLGADPGDVDGQATIKGRLTGPIADPVLRGTLDWTKAILLEVALDSVRAPVEIAFARQTLNSPSMTVLRQKLRADLKVGLILAPKPPDRKLLLKYDLTLNIDGIIDGPWEELLGIFAGGATLSSGQTHLKANVRGTPATLRGQANLGLTDFVILDEPWERVHATVDLQRQRETVSLEGLEFQRGDEKVSGRFEIDFDGVVNWELTSNPLAIQRLVPLQNSGLSGTVTVLSAKGAGSLIRGRVTAELEIGELAYRGVSLGQGHGTLTRDASLDRLRALMAIPERGYQLQAELTTKAPHPYEATLTLEKGDLVTLLSIAQGPMPAQLSAVGSGKIDVAGRLGEKTPEQVTVDLETAQLDINNNDKEKYSFRTAGPTRLTFQGGQLTISPFSIRGEGGDLTAGGTIGEQINVAIQGTAPVVLAAVVSPEIRDAAGLLDVNVKIQGPQRLPRYHGYFRTKDSSLTLRVHPEPIEDLQGEIQFSENAIETSDLQARWGEGKLNAKLQGELAERGWGWRFEFALEDARVERISVTTEGGEPLATGPLRTNGAITAGGGPEFLATLGGQLRLETVDGVMHRSFALERALALINLSGLFRQGPEGKGMPYDEISGTFDIKDGIATTEDLRLRSPAVRASGVGQFDLPNGTVDANMAIQPLQITDSLLKTIGNAPIIKQVGIGTLLFGRKRSIVVVAYRVHGPITDPEVTRVENRVIDQGVLGIFQRTLELPAGTLSRGDSDGDNEASEEKPASAPESSN